jgi:hypothetical protein
LALLTQQPPRDVLLPAAFHSARRTSSTALSSQSAVICAQC